MERAYGRSPENAPLAAVAGARDVAARRAAEIDAFRALLDEMHVNRVKRLIQAGFTTEQAEAVSGLHTPNFM